MAALAAIFPLRRGAWGTGTTIWEERTVADNRQIAHDVVEAVGGKDNITFATHCMTRLRLALKDQSIVDDDKATAIGGFVSGILGGVNEPRLFGVCLEHRRLFKTLTIANVVAGILVGLLHVYFYNVEPPQSCASSALSPTSIP